MKIRLKAPAGLSSTGIYGADGKEMAVGTELTVKEEPKGWAGRYDVLSGGDAKGKTAVTNPAQNPVQEPKAPFEAREKGGGWWAVYDADGKEVGKSMREDDAKAFNDLSADDKAEFIKSEA